MTSLAEPLARAMASRGATFYSPVPEQGTDVDAILAALRADPATLAALAEALEQWWESDSPDRESYAGWAAALADHLFGDPPLTQEQRDVGDFA